MHIYASWLDSPVESPSIAALCTRARILTSLALWLRGFAEGDSIEHTSGLVASLVLTSNYSESFRKSIIQLFQKEFAKSSSEMVRILHTRLHTLGRTQANHLPPALQEIKFSPRIFSTRTQPLNAHPELLIKPLKTARWRPPAGSKRMKRCFFASCPRPETTMWTTPS